MGNRATVDALLTRKKPLTRVVDIVLDGSVVDEWNAAQQAYESAKAACERNNDGPNAAVLAGAEARLDELRPRVEDATVSIELAAIGRRAYEALLAEHPATPEQQKKARKIDPRGGDLAFNAETFPVALLAASMIDPKMSEDEVAEMMDSEAYNSAELTNLIVAAMEVNQTSKVVDLGKG